MPPGWGTCAAIGVLIAHRFFGNRENMIRVTWAPGLFRQRKLTADAVGCVCKPRDHGFGSPATTCVLFNPQNLVSAETILCSLQANVCLVTVLIPFHVFSSSFLITYKFLLSTTPSVPFYYL